MLNKDDIIKILREKNFSKTEYWIVTGTALVMHGVKDETKDIDLGCTTKLFEELIKNGQKVKLTKDNTRSMVVDNVIELFENWNVDNIEFIEGLPVGTLESIIKLKLGLGREKDLKDIEMINEFLDKRNK